MDFDKVEIEVAPVDALVDLLRWTELFGLAVRDLEPRKDLKK